MHGANSAGARENVASVGTERQRLHPRHRGKRQVAIKMWKQRAAARGLPFQPLAQAGGIDRDQQQIALAGEVLGGGLVGLFGGGEMDEAVAEIDRRRP